MNTRTLAVILGFFFGTMLTLALSGCGIDTHPGIKTGIPPSGDDFSDVVIHGKYDFEVTVGRFVSRNVTGSVSHATSVVNVSVTNNAASTFALGAFAPAAIGTQTETTSNVTLGTIGVTNVFDNDLMHCGVGATHKCTTAGIGAYWSTATTSLTNGLTAGDQELMPLALSSGFLSLTTLSATTQPGLLLNTISISSGNVKTAQMCATPANCVFTFTGDFSSVGAGTFTGSVTVVYFIAN